MQPYPNIALKFNRYRPPLLEFSGRRSKVHGFTHKIAIVRQSLAAANYLCVVP